MEKKVTVVLVLLFCVLYTAAIAAQERNKSSLNNADATRTEVTRLGFGKRVRVKLQNGTNAEGRITGFADDHFVLTDQKGAALKIQFANVARVTKQNEKLRVFEKPFAAFAITAAFVGTFLVLTMGVFK